MTRLDWKYVDTEFDDYYSTQFQHLNKTYVYNIYCFEYSPVCKYNWRLDIRVYENDQFIDLHSYKFDYLKDAENHTYNHVEFIKAFT